MFGVRWQNYELWSSAVNLSSLAVMKDEKNDDGGSERSPPVVVKCQSPDMVCFISVASYYLMVAVLTVLSLAWLCIVLVYIRIAQFLDWA